jgi:Ca-activated chloride channel family protein
MTTRVTEPRSLPGRTSRLARILTALAGLALCAVSPVSGAGCGGASTVAEPEAGTLATLTPVRGSAAVEDAPVMGAGRVPHGASVSVEAAAEGRGGGLARLVLDAGPSFLLDAGARLLANDVATVQLETGRVLATAADGEPLALEGAGGSVRLSDATVSATASQAGLELYVVRGEASYVAAGGERGVARAGELLTLPASGAPSVRAQTLFEDWTGGLFTTGPGESFAPGMGVLEARVPDEIGQARWPLSIRRLDVSVQIVGELAVTEVEEEFFNPASETVEGLYRIRVPEGAVLQRFAVDRNGQMVDGFVREEAQARAAYEAQVYRGSTDDPALLSWDAPGSYRARIYPIAPGEVRRIAVRYAEWLRPTAEGGPRLYRYPMGEGGRAPHVQELSFRADVSRAEVTAVRAGMGATVEPGRVELRRSDFRPRADLYIELTPREPAQHAFRGEHRPPRRAPGSRVIVGEADERDYWYLPLRLPDSVFVGETEAPRGLDLVIVADVSAGTDRAKLELGRSVVEALASHLGPEDRVSIVSADLAIRGVVEGEGATALGPAESGRLEALLDGLARVPSGGATDLGAAIAQASALLDPARQGAVVYVGDGAPTVGELGAEGLVEHLLELPRPVRLYAVGIGRDANLDLLSALSRGGGLAVRVEEREGAADATLRILSHVSRPILQRVTVELGTGIDNAFPRVPVDVARGEVIDVVGRVREAPPTEIVVRGLRRGEPFEHRVTLDTRATDEDADLRLRWANERLRQLLLGGASREEIAELGTRCGLITPYTSYYVPSAREMASGMYGSLEHVPLLTPREEEPGIGETLASAALALALGPLTLTGCSYGSMPEPPAWLSPATESAPASAPVQAGPEGYYADEEQMAREAPATTMPTTPAAPMPSPAPPPASAAAPAEPEMAEMPGDSIGGNFGFGGLGMRGSGRGGGGTGEGTIGLGTLGSEGTTGQASAEPSPEPSADRAAVDDLLAGALGPASGGDGAAGPARMRRSAAARPRPDLDLRAQLEQQLVERSEDSSRERDREDGAPGHGGGGGRYGTTTTIVTTIVTTPSHQRQRCSDASRRSLDDRAALWRERLGQTDYVGSWVEAYREAIRRCEIASGRDRRVFLDAMLDRAGSLPRMVEVYQYLPDASARGFFRAAILRRVRTADDLRLVRNAFGLSSGVDWALVEQVLARATTPAGRLRALRQLVQQTPGSFELQLRLLEELEAQRRVPEARRLAERLRADPLADPGVRTAIGELYLRLDLEDEARRTFSEIVEFQPLDELARRRLGDLYRAHGWYEDAYRQYETLVSIRPDDPTALLLLAQAAAGAGRVDEALRLEQRVMETSERGATEGLARTAMLWSSVRFAELRKSARERGAQPELDALLARMRRSSVLRNAHALRVSLVWSHPDANVSLWTSHPGLSLTRPDDLYSELGIEAFDVAEQEALPYRIEVRRNVRDRLGAIEARLVVVWNEGQADEQIEIVPLTFDADHRAHAWTITGRALAEAAPSAEALRTDDDAPSIRTNGGAR